MRAAPERILALAALTLAATALAVGSAVAFQGDEPSASPQYAEPTSEVFGVAKGVKRRGDRVVGGLHRIPVRDPSGLLDYGRVNGFAQTSHGPDPLPRARRRLRQELPITPPSNPLGASAGPPESEQRHSVQCLAPGSSNYFEILYYVAQGQSDGADLAALSREVGYAVEIMAQEAFTVNGAYRMLRVDTEATESGACVPRVQVVYGNQSATDYGSVVGDLAASGYKRPDRKYIAFVAGAAGCGQATIYRDYSKSATNQHNTRTGYALIKPNCWDRQGHTVMHEVAHNLSAVQARYPGYDGAPHNNTLGPVPAYSNERWHCTDESDVVCQNDASPQIPSQTVCDDGREWLDCNHDDYFNPAPPPGSWLDTHFDLANDSFWVTADDWTDPLWLTRPTAERVVPQQGSNSDYQVQVKGRALDNWGVARFLVTRSPRVPRNILSGDCPGADDSRYAGNGAKDFEVAANDGDSDETLDVTDGWQIAQSGCYRFDVSTRDRAGRRSEVVMRVVKLAGPTDLVLPHAPTDKPEPPQSPSLPDPPTLIVPTLPGVAQVSTTLPVRQVPVLIAVRRAG